MSKRIYLLAAVIAGIVIVGFQNCGKTVSFTDATVNEKSSSSVEVAGFHLDQASNHLDVTVSWSQLGDHAGCYIEFQDSYSRYVRISHAGSGGKGNGFDVGRVNPLRFDCSGDNPGIALELGNVWKSYGAKNIRIVDADSGAVIANADHSLVCAPMPASNTPTPTIDEDCDGNNDNVTNFVRGTCGQLADGNFCVGPQVEQANNVASEAGCIKICNGSGAACCQYNGSSCNYYNRYINFSHLAHMSGSTTRASLCGTAKYN